MTLSSPRPFTVPIERSVNAAESLELFRRWGDDGMDRWDGRFLVRTVRCGERCAAYAAEWRDSAAAFEVWTEGGADQGLVEAEISRTFVRRPAGFAALSASDPVIGRLDKLYPGLRPVRQPDLLHALVRHVSAQQINLRWAVTTRRRLAETFGDRHEVGEQAVYSLNGGRLAAAGVDAIRALQFTTRKAEYIVGIGAAIASGALELTDLDQMPDEEVIARLTSIRGIGVWTAEWILARTMDRPRVVAGDLAVRKAVGIAYLADPLPSEREVREAASHWGDGALHAQALLLHAFASGTLTAADALPAKEEPAALNPGL